MYGVRIKLYTQSDYNNLIKDLNRSFNKITSSKVDVILFDENEKWYPPYWGKDINPSSRIRAHFRTEKGTR